MQQGPEEVRAGLLAGDGSPDLETCREQSAGQRRPFGCAAKQKDAFPHGCASEKYGHV